jgi:TATA-box binding protein (TBP) (component of TFIID and TFIIIB)
MTETTLTDSLTVQNVVASTAIDAEHDLQPLIEAFERGGVVSRSVG